ncbi:uncharacterized protein LOC129004096 [Macrosteles quadrilineatus]|uniref:uncharacterized protein LOC129004096 n=1 Tax=Macrosteles quadrilineatus TaxID=74068 RepID=UPI0023E0CB95|nr:uncharacterized protein LOC129004096 [Macrosteles quadrilineatus]
MSLPFIRSFVVKNILRAQYFVGSPCGQNSFHSVTSPGTTSIVPSASNIASSAWSLTFIRTCLHKKIRNNWPRPSEKKRQKMNFWNRMKTPAGRAIIMRRYLKGRHVLAH